MSDVDIVIQVATAGVQNVIGLSNAMLQLNRAVSGATIPMRNLDSRARALSQAIGSTDGSLKNHAKSVGELTRNNTILSSELNRTKAMLKGLGTEYKFATGTSNEFKTAAIRDLKAYEQALKGVRIRALTEDLKSLSQEQKRLGKDAQFVGRSLIIGLTTPIMLFGRYGLQALVGVDREFIRLNKVLESVAPNLDAAAKKMGIDLSNATDKQNKQLQKMVDNYEKLDRKLTATSTKFGLSKNITVGLAGEFAELGIQSTDAIAKITELTAATEKIGNMDIGSSKDLVQALYFQAQRALQQSGEGSRMSFLERENRAIEAATAQLRLFNSVENVTALTLRDLGDAFPEVAAAATSFGLSMTEAGALLAPMKAAGFEVGASANSIKVSLQRIVAPTKQNAEMLKALEEQYKVSFTGIKGTGLDAIQLLVDGFNKLKNSTAGQEGAMEFFAKLFGVRQGPRMEVAIAQMAEFDAILKSDVIPSTTSAEKKLQEFANTAILAGNKTAGTNLPLVKSFKDIGIIARIASSNIAEGQQKTIEGFGVVGRKEVLEARKVRDALSKEILEAQRSGGEDLIGQISSEAGRAMFVQLAGGANAAEVAQRELKASLGSLDVQISILRNNFKMFAADLIARMKPAIEKITDLSTRLYNAWKELTPQTRKLITTLVLGFAGVTAAIGPLIFVFGQFRLAVGSIGKVIFGFLPGLQTMTIEMLASRSAMLNLKNPLTSIGDTVYNTNGKFATFIATIASGDGPLANFAKKIGKTTGVLKESTTAQMSVTRTLLRYNREQSVAVAGAVPGVGTISRTPIEPAIPKTKEVEESIRKRLLREMGSGAAVKGGVGSVGQIKNNLAKEAVAAAGFTAPKGVLNFGKLYQDITQQMLVSSGYATVRGGRGAGGAFAKAAPDLLAEAETLQAAGYTSASARMRGSGGRFVGMTKSQRDALKALEDAQSLAQTVMDDAKNASKNIVETARKKADDAYGKMRALSEKQIDFNPLTNKTTYKGREVSDKRASDIYRGGVRGQIAKASEAVGRKTDASDFKIKDIGKKAKDFATAPVKAYQASVAGASASVAALRAQHAAAGVEAPRFFARMSAAMKGFATATNLGTAALKIMKLTLIASGIGIIILSIGVAVMLVMKNMDKFKKAGAGGLKALKEAFDIVKNAAMEVIRPIIDLFSSFGNGAQGTEGAVSGIGNAFNALAGVIKFVAKLFASVVEKFIKPYLYMIVNIVGAVVSLFQGNWKKAFSFLMAGVAFAVDFFVNAFALGFKLIVSLAGGLVKAVVSIIGVMIKALIEGLVSPITAVLDLASKLPFGIGAKFKGIKESFKGVVDGAKGMVDSATGVVNGVVDSAVKGTNGFIDKAAGGLKKKVDGLKKGGVKQSKDKISIGGSGSDAEVDAEPLQEEIANATGEGLTEGADAGGKALANKIKGYLSDLKKEVQSDIADRIKTTIDNVVTALKEGLKSQKEASLKIYDDQLKKIDETAKAEEKLTKTKEYENKKRELEEQRALNRLNNQRNYNLAVYEGRIDDARQIAMEGQRNEQDDSDKIKDLETSRSKELADQRREDLISSIKDARESSSKYFDEMIETFTNAAKKITEFPPTTAEKFNEQLELLKTAANTGANAIGTSFEEGFTGVLGNLGVNATGPLTSALQTITDTIVANNPFGETGVWQKTIDASLDGLKAKYEGMTDTLNMVIDENSSRFKALFEVYKSYKLLVDTDTSGATGAGPGGATGGGPGGASGKNPYGFEQVGKGGIVTGRGMAQVVMGNYRGSNGQTVLKYLENAFNMVKQMQPSESVLTIFSNFLQKYPTLSSESNKSTLAVVKNLFMRGATSQGYNGYKLRQIGGPIPYGDGGPTQGPVQQGIPAILHGGEYVVRNSAVKKYGWGMMEQINRGAYKPKPFANGGRVRLGNRVDPKQIQATKEFNWQQNNGGFTQSYWDKVGKAETDMNLQHSNSNFAGAYGMTKANWLDYGGAQFAESADKATKIQQLVINNRKAVFGFINKIEKNPGMPRGATQLMFPTGTGGWSTIGEGKKVNEPFNIENSFISETARQKYINNRNKNYFRGTGEIGSKDYRPPHERRIQIYGQNLLRVPKAAAVQNQENKPLEFLNDLILKGQYPSAQSANRFNGGMLPEYKIGGVVKSGTGKSISDPKKKKQSGFWNVMDKIQGGVNSSMNFAAGLLDYSGKQIKAMTYDPLVRLQEATLNPLMQILRVPGSKNLKVATPTEAAYSGFETGLAAFGGPATARLMSKLATIGVKGGMGPIERLVTGISGKATSMTSNFGINEAFAGTRDAKIAAIAKSKAMENKIRFNVDKSRLAREAANFRDTGFADEYLPVPKGGFRRPKLGRGRSGFMDAQATIDEIASIRRSMRLKNIEELSSFPAYGTPQVGVGTSFEQYKLNRLKNKLSMLQGYDLKSSVRPNIDMTLPKDSNLIRKAVQENVRISQATRAASKYNTPLPRTYYSDRSFQDPATRQITRSYKEMVDLGVEDALEQFPRDKRIQILRPQTPRQFNETYDFFTPFAKARDAQKAIEDAAKLAAAQKRQLAKTAEGLSKRELAKISAFSKPAMADIPLSLQKDKLMIAMEVEDPYDFIEINAWRPVESYKGFGVDAVKNTASISGYLNDIASGPLKGKPYLSIGSMGATDDMIGQLDAIKLLFAMYEKFIKPSGVNYIDPGSLSKYSANLVGKLQNIIGSVNPDIQFIDGFTGRAFQVEVSNNTPRARGGGYLAADKPIMGDVKDIIDDILADKVDIYKDLTDRIQIDKLMRQAIRNRSANKFNGGLIPSFANGGIVPNFDSMSVPAILHGGEYVVNSKAVKNIGFAALEAMNNMRFNTPKSPSYAGPVQPQTSSTSNVNIYVDNFIGEKQWFESMMKDYNINVSPQNQKTAGLQNRTISTYNGINRGM